MNRSANVLILRKNGERFLFSYADGRESDVLGVLVDLAEDPRSEFDWFDAAALSFQMGRSDDRAWDPGLTVTG